MNRKSTTEALKMAKKYILVIGGPGVGKGTQCALAAARLNAQHISTGQLLRNEQKSTGSPYAETITQCFNTSVPAPPKIITALMRAAVSADGARRGGGVVLLDGFPRSIEQLDDFKKEVSSTFGSICLVASEQTLASRLELRVKEGKRADDTKDMIQQRIQAEEKNLKLLLNSLREGGGPLFMVDAGGDVEQIQVEFREAVEKCAQQL